MYLGKQVLCLLKVVVKGSSHRGVRGPRCYWQASLSDVSTVFIHYSSVERWKHSTPASWTHPPPPTPGDSTLGPRLRWPCLQPDSVPAGKIRPVYFPYAFLLQVGIQKESCAGSSRGENCVIKSERAKTKYINKWILLWWQTVRMHWMMILCFLQLEECNSLQVGHPAAS